MAHCFRYYGMHLMGVADGFGDSRCANGSSFSGYFQEGTAHGLFFYFCLFVQVGPVFLSDGAVVWCLSVVWWYGVIVWFGRNIWLAYFLELHF